MKILAKCLYLSSVFNHRLRCRPHYHIAALEIDLIGLNTDVVAPLLC